MRNSAAAGPVPVAVATGGTGDVQRKPSEAQLAAELDKREKQSFDQAAQQIRDVVNNDPQLAELARGTGQFLQLWIAVHHVAYLLCRLVEGLFLTLVQFRPQLRLAWLALDVAASRRGPLRPEPARQRQNCALVAVAALAAACRRDPALCYLTSCGLG